MRSENRYLRVLAVLCLGSLAAAVHAQTGRTRAEAAFPDVDATKAAAAARTLPSSEIAEGDDLKRALGPRRSSRAVGRMADLSANPYDAASNQAAFPPVPDEPRSDERAEETAKDDRWSNPYAVVRLDANDERWSNPYVAVQNTQTDERWSNPYAPSVHR